MASPTIRFTCPACSGTIKALATQAGQTCHCPRCQQTVRIPGAAGTSSTVTAAPAAPTTPAAEPAPPVAQTSPTPAGAVAASSGSPSEAPLSASSVRSAELARRPAASETTATVTGAAADVTPSADDDHGYIIAAEDSSEVTGSVVRCPLCRSTLVVAVEQLGEQVVCEDCHTTFTAEAAAPRSAPRAAATPSEPADFQLSAPVKTPRYVPSPADGVDAAELYGDEPATEPAEPAAPQPAYVSDEVGIVCPLCHSRLYVRRSQVGQTIRCADCHHQFPITLPRPAAKDAASAHRGAEFETDEIRLSEVVERPKYQPLTKREISREQLDTIERRPTASAAPSPPQPEPVATPPSAVELPVEFVIICRHCGSRLQVNQSQIGAEIRCSDCHSPLTVSKPRPRPVRKRAVVAEPEAEALPPVLAGADQSRVYNQQAQSLLQTAEAEQAAADRAAASFARLPYWQQLTGFLFEPGTAFRLMLCSIGMTILFFTMGNAVALADKGMMAAYSIVLIVMSVLALVPTFLYLSNCGVAIVVSTSAGDDRVEHSGDEMYMDWLTPAAYCLLALAVSGIPGGALAASLVTAAAPAWSSWGCLAASVLLLFPFVLMSMLEGASMFYVFSPLVFESLLRVPAAWLRLVLTVIVIGAGFATMYYLAATGWLLAMAAGALGTVALAFIFFRAIGLAAASCRTRLEQAAE